MLDELGLARPDLPVVVLRFAAEPTALINPSNAQIVDAFGVITPIPPGRSSMWRWSARPAGLAAVGASSEGLSTVVIEQEAVGRQAGPAR